MPLLELFQNYFNNMYFYLCKVPALNKIGTFLSAVDMLSSTSTCITLSRFTSQSSTSNTLSRFTCQFFRMSSIVYFVILLAILNFAVASHKKGISIAGAGTYICGDEQAFTNVHWW